MPKPFLMRDSTDTIKSIAAFISVFIAFSERNSSENKPNNVTRVRIHLLWTCSPTLAITPQEEPKLCEICNESLNMSLG